MLTCLFVYFVRFMLPMFVVESYHKQNTIESYHKQDTIESYHKQDTTESYHKQDTISNCLASIVIKVICVEIYLTFSHSG